jgi:hypothetical protein
MAQKTEKEKPLGKYENCRVVEVGLDKFAECLKQGPATCSYAIPFGYCFLCNHPRVNEMLENTKQQQPFTAASL